RELGDGAGGGDGRDLDGLGDAELEGVGACFISHDAVQRLQVEQFRRRLRELDALLREPALHAEVPDTDAAGAIDGGAVLFVVQVGVSCADEIAGHKAVCLRCAFDVPSVAVGGGGEGVHVDVTEVAASPGFEGDFTTWVGGNYFVDLSDLRQRAVPEAGLAVRQ